MAKENIAKFYESLASDKTLAEKLMEAEKAYRETHEPPAAAADEKTLLALRRDEVKGIILPIAAEAGFPFTVEEMEVFEKEQIAAMQMSEDELEQVAGGVSAKFSWGAGAQVCGHVGAGVGGTIRDEDALEMTICGVVGVHEKDGNPYDKPQPSVVNLCVICGLSLYW